MPTPYRKLLKDLLKIRIVGNAFNDRDLIDSLTELADSALCDNDVETAYDAIDYIGTGVMGVPALQSWDEFLINVRVLCHDGEG